MDAITVSQLNRYVRSLLEGDGNLHSLLISGEISNFTNHYASGHLYFTLKDASAAIKAVMFRSQAMYLRFKPENGMKVIVRGRVSLYEKDGAYQLYIDEMQPDGAGALQIAFEQLKARLQAEGLFDSSRKRPLPPYPQRVGIITSATGAAVQDIFNVLGRRYPAAQVLLIPVLVQGEGAPADLCRALTQFARMKRENHPQTPDVIIIGRGGGSLEELWAFNDEALARAVAASPIPVISAVGHETDFTICDFAADLRAPTPSAAAELAVPDQKELQHRVARLSGSLAAALTAAVEQKSRQLELLCSRRCLSQPLYYVEERTMQLDYVLRSFSAAADTLLSKNGTRLSALAGKLDAMSPLRVIARGYAMATRDDTVITSAAELSGGDKLSLQFHDGSVQCRVEENDDG